MSAGSYRMRFAAATVLLACLSGCGGDEARTKQIVETKITLRTVCLLVWLAEEESSQEPPTTLSKLVIWIQENAANNEDRIDYDRQTIEDSWGRAIVLITDNGRLTSLGSAGPNGLWEGGGGDDVVLGLAEVRRQSSAASGPAGE